MNEQNIDDNETLFRAVKNRPDYWKNNKPTSAVFKDSRGVSVERDRKREKSVIYKSFEKKFNLKAIVSVVAKTSMNIGVYPVPMLTKNNKYHAEIHSSSNRILLSKSQAKSLSTAVSIEKIY